MNNGRLNGFNNNQIPLWILTGTVLTPADSSWTIGGIDLTGYVPYTGATTNVDLGTHTLKTGNEEIYLTTLGTEKLANGTFSGSATGWIVGSGWAYNTNLVRKQTDGTNPVYQNAPSMAIPLQLGEVVTLTYTISNWTVGSVTPSCGGVTLTTRSSDGTYTETFKVTNTGSALAFVPTNTARFYLDTVSLKRFSDGSLFVGGNINTGTINGGTFSGNSSGNNTGDQSLTPYWKNDGTSIATGNWLNMADKYLKFSRTIDEAELIYASTYMGEKLPIPAWMGTGSGFTNVFYNDDTGNTSNAGLVLSQNGYIQEFGINSPQFSDEYSYTSGGGIFRFDIRAVLPHPYYAIITKPSNSDAQLFSLTMNLDNGNLWLGRDYFDESSTYKFKVWDGTSLLHYGFTAGDIEGNDNYEQLIVDAGGVIIQTGQYAGMSDYWSTYEENSLYQTSFTSIVKMGSLKSGTLASPPSGLVAGELWKDTTTSTTYPIIRIKV